MKADGTGAATLVTAVFSSSGGLGGLGTVKDTLNNSAGTTAVSNTTTTTSQTEFVSLQVSKLVMTTSAQSLTARVASGSFTVESRDGINAARM